jgi:hypothetical protein
VRESRMLGSVRGALSNGCSYRDPRGAAGRRGAGRRGATPGRGVLPCRRRRRRSVRVVDQDVYQADRLLDE